MIVNEIVANFQFPLIKAYQITEKQSSTRCQWTDKVNRANFIHQWQCMCPNENKKSLAEVSKTNKMILPPGLAIKIWNEKDSESYGLMLKGISSENVCHKIQMTLMRCGRQ